MPIHITIDQGAGGHHLGIKDSFLRQQSMKPTAIGVSPIQHGRDAKASVYGFVCHFNKIVDLLEQPFGQRAEIIPLKSALFTLVLSGYNGAPEPR